MRSSETASKDTNGIQRQGKRPPLFARTKGRVARTPLHGPAVCPKGSPSSNRSSPAPVLARPTRTTLDEARPPFTTAHSTVRTVTQATAIFVRVCRAPTTRFDTRRGYGLTSTLRCTRTSRSSTTWQRATPNS